MSYIISFWVRLILVEKYEAKRYQMARHESNKLGECRNCHNFSQMNAGKQKAATAKQHALAQTQDKTCIDC